jgi:hypothetical protein
MTSNIPRPEDTFTDWLDASLAGRSTPANDAQADSDLAAMQAAADQFHGLVARSSQYAVTVRPRTRSWEDLMSSASMASPPITGRPGEAPVAPTNRRETRIRKWDRAASLFLTATILLAVVFGLNRAYPGGNDDPPVDDANSGFIPMPTVDPETGLSAYPLVTADECTQEPMTRDEIVAHLTAANTATDTYWETRYEQAVGVSAEDEAAVTAIIREWQACNLRGKGPVYGMRLETPWMTAQFERSVRQSEGPASSWEIEQRADQLLNDPELDLNATPVPPATPATPVAPYDTDADDPPVTVVPLPEDGTPIGYPEGRGRVFPSMIEGDMQMVGPDRIVAPLYWIDENTREVLLLTPYSVQFIRVDGVWLVNFYGDPDKG